MKSPTFERETQAGGAGRRRTHATGFTPFQNQPFVDFDVILKVQPCVARTIFSEEARVVDIRFGEGRRRTHSHED
jgi:hypothetical protein